MPKGPHPKRPRDPNQLAKLIVGIVTGEAVEEREKPSLPDHPRKKRGQGVDQP